MLTLTNLIGSTMPGHGISAKTLSSFLDKVPWAKIAKKASDTSQGQRLFPSRTPKNDSNYNFRIDKGTNKGGKSELIIQANKNAKDKKVKEAAQKNSHAVLATSLLDTEEDQDGKDARKQLEADFKKRQ